MEVILSKSSRSVAQIVGIALVVVGIGLAIWGYQLDDSISSQIKEAITGSPKDRVMTYYIGGAVCFVVGLFLFTKK